MIMEKSCQFSERFLQALWNERHIKECCFLVSGKRLNVLSSGIWNVSGGPDFRKASLLIDGHVVNGDVEIHRQSSDWFRHGHDGDPAYGNVVLHVVWNNDSAAKEDIETLVLPESLQYGWQALLNELDASCYPYARQIPAGECSLKWAMTSDDRVRKILLTSGMTRFAARAQLCARMAADVGHEQALYELLFEALGYKANRENFLQLARHASLAKLQGLASNEAREAMLFGAAGFIPDVTRDNILDECREYALRLWEHWWNSGMQKAAMRWNVGGTRPFNNPCRRLAAGVGMLERMEYKPFAWLKEAALSSNAPHAFMKRLHSLNQPENPWREYIDFSHKATPTADLIGKSRLLDFAANVFLPFLYGVEGNGENESPLQHFAKKTYMSLPLSQGNRLFKEAVQRFLTPPSRVVDLVKNTCHQQGMLYIYKNLCQALGNNCRECPSCMR